MSELHGESVSLRKAYNDGYGAYHYGFSISKCPFEKIVLKVYWKKGWYDSHKDGDVEMGTR